MVDRGWVGGVCPFAESSSVKIGTGVKGRKILYIQMEFCSTTLRELIDDHKLEKMEENEIWRLVRQITEALAYIHGRKLIHRDLKPGEYTLGETRVRVSAYFSIFVWLKGIFSLTVKATFAWVILGWLRSTRRKASRTLTMLTMTQKPVRFIMLLRTYRVLWEGRGRRKPRGQAISSLLKRRLQTNR